MYPVVYYWFCSSFADRSGYKHALQDHKNNRSAKIIELYKSVQEGSLWCLPFKLTFSFKCSLPWWREREYDCDLKTNHLVMCRFVGVCKVVKHLVSRRVRVKKNISHEWSHTSYVIKVTLSSLRNRHSS